MSSMLMRCLCRGSVSSVLRARVTLLRTLMGPRAGDAATRVVIRPLRGLGKESAILRTLSLGLAGFKLLPQAPHPDTTSQRKPKSRVDDFHNWEQNQKKKKKEEEASFDWWRFLKLLYPHAWYLLAAVASAMIAAALNIQIPKMLGDIVNVLANYSGKDSNLAQECGAGSGAPSFVDEIKAPALRLIKIYLAQGVFTFGYIYSLSCVGERVAAEMRSLLFSSVVRQDITFFDSRKSGELVSRLATDVQDFKSSFKLCVSQGLRSAAQVAGCGAALVAISPQMTGGMLVVVPLVIGIGTLLGSLLRNLSKKAQAQVAQATAVGEECISNVRTVRAFAMEDMERSLYNGEVEKSRILNETLGWGIGLFQAATNVFLNGIVLGTLYYGGYLLSSNQLSAGDLMSFLVATQTIQRSLAQMSLLFGQFVKGMAAGARVLEYIALEPSIPERGGRIIPFRLLLGDVEFRNVHFSYSTRPGQVILRGFNLRILPGRVVALVGESGGGKSTVASLLERFYDFDGGAVLVDGVDIRQLDPRWLRGRAVGYVDQEAVLFATSVRENIRYGRPDASDREVCEVIKAANAHGFIKAANAHGFIKAFPDGYDTVFGERGVTVSGSQKQRIAIARALLKNPTILILDEATSALDAESEKVVQDALDTAAKGRMVLVIAHRLSTIQNADTIAVLSGGRVAELGDHTSLKRLGGIYHNLIRQQEKEDGKT